MRRFVNGVIASRILLVAWIVPLPCVAQTPNLPAPLSAKPASPTAVTADSGQGSAPALETAPAGPPGKVGLEGAPLEPADLPLPINLAAALQLADARPLIVAGAQATAWVAEAQLQPPSCSGFPRSTWPPFTSGTTALARISTEAPTMHLTSSTTPSSRSTRTSTGSTAAAA